VASGAVERASLELLWSVLSPSRRFIPQGSLSIDYAFETGVAHVEFLPEAGKLNVNTIPPELLARLLVALGVDPIRSEAIAANIVAWRKPGVATLAVPMNLAVPTFETPHASFQGIEEMLNVQGVTPELFYGSYAPAPEGAPPGTPRLLARPGLVDCLSVLGGKDYLDINTAEPAVLAALGAPAEEVSAILETRRIAPIRQSALGAFPPPPGVRFQLEGNSIVTIRATAQARLPNGGISDVKRTVAAMVKYMPDGYDSPIHVLRWYDTSFAASPWTMRPSPIPLGAAPPETGSN
jgi:general secretion pathway protein K